MKKILIILAFIIIPVIVFLADIFNITQYIKITKNYDWLGFLGSIYASAITIVGVVWTLKNQSEEENRKRKEEFKPEIIIDINSIFVEDIYNDESDASLKIILKNVGKETAKNIICKIMIKDLEKQIPDGVEIIPEKEIIRTDNETIFRYLSNAQYKILALQKDESKELGNLTIEMIIKMLDKIRFRQYSEKFQNEKGQKLLFICDIDIKNIIRIEIEYEDLLKHKYYQEFELLLEQQIINYKEKKIQYSVKIVM